MANPLLSGYLQFVHCFRNKSHNSVTSIKPHILQLHSSSGPQVSVLNFCSIPSSLFHPLRPLTPQILSLSISFNFSPRSFAFLILTLTPLFPHSHPSSSYLLLDIFLSSFILSFRLYSSCRFKTSCPILFLLFTTITILLLIFFFFVPFSL